MAIPDYQTLMLPLLKIASDEKEHSLKEALDVLSKEFDLSTDELSELLPSGTQTIIYNRIGWARTYMKKAGLLTAPKRGHFQITERGKELIQKNPDKINVNGGAVALGHPVGASGCRVLVTLLHEMKKTDKKTGLASLCLGGGEAVSLIVKR